MTEIGNDGSVVPSTGHQPDKGASGAVSPTLHAQVGLEDITHWLMLRSPGGDVGHILMSSYSHWHTTACGTMTPNGQIVQERPARKCRKCMGRLPTLKRSQPNAKVMV